jgi:hypothetical protein
MMFSVGDFMTSVDTRVMPDKRRIFMPDIEGADGSPTLFS